MKKHLSIPVLACASFLLSQGICLADTSWTGAIDNDYNNPGNWDNGRPTAYDGPYNPGTIGVAINNPVMITSNTPLAPRILIANGPGQQGSLTVDNVNFGQDNNDWWVIAIELGVEGGTGVFTQIGSSAVTYSGYNTMGRNSTAATTTMNILGGQIIGMNWRVGGAGTGTLNLANATLRIMNKGALGHDQALVIGGGLATLDNGTGIFNIGDADNPGTVNFYRQWEGQGTSIMVRNHPDASGTLRGWGAIATVFGYATLPDQDPFGGTVTVNGWVIADGYGVNRDLDLTNNPRGVRNTIENTSSNGWFAVNKGRLVLPPLAVSGGNSSVIWGEAADDTSIDLVNSAQLAFTDATAGNLAGALLAADRTDVPAGLMKPVGIWSFNGVACASVVMTLRYDHGAAATQGVQESALKLWRHNGAKWVDVTASRDDAVKTITSQPVDSLAAVTFFAVAPTPPSTGTVVTIQ